MIETPASVQIIKEICKEGIDFVSFGTNDLTQYTLAVDRGNEQVQELYDDLHPSVLSQLAYVIKICRENNVETSICGQAGSKKEMVKFLVEQGISSISVNADSAADIAEYITELEKEEVGVKKPEEETHPGVAELEEEETEESAEGDSGEEDVAPPYTFPNEEDELPVIPGTEYTKIENEEKENEEKEETRRSDAMLEKIEETSSMLGQSREIRTETMAGEEKEETRRSDAELKEETRLSVAELKENRPSVVNLKEETLDIF